MSWYIPLSDIDFGPEEMDAVNKVLARKGLTMGEVTQRFEEAFAAYTGAKHALAITNATAALHMACTAVGLEPGSEVILPSLTFVVSATPSALPAPAQCLQTFQVRTISAENVAARQVTLPLYPGMNDDDVVAVAEAACNSLLA